MATEIGTVLDGKYEILKQIGKGGMSVVYLAMDKHLNKQWAVKEIKKVSGGKNEMVAVNSLIAEANLMKRLDHPALPRIVDIIEKGNTLYVIMDYIEGESLDKVLKEYGAQPEETVINWAVCLCDTLGYLHSQKPPIIYRDMKPANVMLKPEGNLKVIDFGIAREYKEKNLSDTTVLGTNGYAAPEQYGSRQTDARSDIYALGMTMHHLLTGVDPRPADYMYASVRKWNAELSEGIEFIVDKCTALDPEERYQNCDELMYDLQHPEQVGQGMIQKQKRKLRIFFVSAVLTVVFMTVGMTGQFLRIHEKHKNYEHKINISESTSYETKVKTYLEAIELIGGDTRGYRKLLGAYTENGRFGEKESNQFTAKYNENREKFDTESEGYLQLLYEAGVLYFYLYSGGDDSFRTRILKAYPYFATIVRSGNEDYKYQRIAESYYMIGDFYMRYVVNSTSVKEPTKEAYTELLNSMLDCMNQIENYEYDDAAYIKLTMYYEIEKLIFEHRKGFAATGVDKIAVTNIVESVQWKTENLAVTQQKSIELRDRILKWYEECIGEVNRAYENTR